MSNHNDIEALAQLHTGTLRADHDQGIVWRNGNKCLSKSNGYIRTSLGNGRNIFAHRVVWLSAHGHIPDGLVINHKNRIRHDNRLINLEAITARENVWHASGSHQYAGVRPEDVEAVDPLWLADMLRRAAAGEAPPERGSGPADVRVARSRIKYAI